jgi:hypothetical protein
LYRKPDDANKWYDFASLEGPVNAIRNATAGLRERPRVLESHSYAAHYAGGTGYTPPWTDLNGLLYYMQAHQIDYLCFDHYLVDHPFAADMDSTQWETTFTQIYAGTDSSDEPYYIFVRNQ